MNHNILSICLIMWLKILSVRHLHQLAECEFHKAPYFWCLQTRIYTTQQKKTLCIHIYTIGQYQFQMDIIIICWAATKTRFSINSHWVTLKGPWKKSIALHIYTIFCDHINYKRLWSLGSEQQPRTYTVTNRCTDQLIWWMDRCCTSQMPPLNPFMVFGDKISKCWKVQTCIEISFCFCYDHWYH